MIHNKTIKRVGALLVSTALIIATSACNSTGTNKAPEKPVARTAIVKWPGNLPGVQNPSQPARWSDIEIEQILYLQNSCVQQLEAQLPGPGSTMTKDAALYGVGNLIGGLIGSYLGYPNIEAWREAARGFGFGAGSGLASGYNRYSAAWDYAIGACMYWQIYWANTNDDALKGIGVVAWMADGKVKLPAASDPITRELPKLGSNPQPLSPGQMPQ